LALQRLLARAPAAYGINLELPKVGSKRATGDLECGRLPPPPSSPKASGKKSAGNLATDKLAKVCPHESQREWIDVADATRLCDQQAIVVAANVACPPRTKSSRRAAAEGSAPEQGCRLWV